MYPPHQKRLLVEKEYDIRARNGIALSPKDLELPSLISSHSLAPSMPHSPKATRERQSPVKRFSPVVSPASSPTVLKQSTSFENGSPSAQYYQQEQSSPSYLSSPRTEPHIYSSTLPVSPLSPKRTNYSPSLQKPAPASRSPYIASTEPSRRPNEPNRVVERLSSDGMRKSGSVNGRSSLAEWTANVSVTTSPTSPKLGTNSPKAHGNGFAASRPDFSPLKQTMDSFEIVKSHFSNGDNESDAGIQNADSSSFNNSLSQQHNSSSPLVTSRNGNHSSPGSTFASRGSPRHSLEPSSPVHRRLSSSASTAPSSPAPISIPAPKSLFNPNTSFAEKSIQNMYENEARESQSKRSLLWLAREFRARQEYERSARYYVQLMDLYQVEEEEQFELGEIYHIALKEYRLAAQCYRRILDKNPYHVSSLVNLGLLHFDGLGVTTDRYQAVKLWNRALRVDTRCVLALQCIAYCYYSGLGGLPISYVKARDFAELVLEYADVLNPMERTIAADAAYVLAHMYRRGYDTPRNYKRALAYYEKSATMGNFRAYVSIARMYQVELRDEEEADHFYDHYMRQAVKAEAAAGEE